MTTTPQAALLSDAAKLADEYRVTMPREVFAIWGAEAQAELRRLDALVAHLTADRDDTANELALRTKHNLALTNERDQLLAKLQATQAEPVQAGELPPPPTLSDDERQWLHYNPNTSDIEEWVYGYAVAYARAALSARKP